MRKIRVLYVEDDPALMGLVVEKLNEDQRIELVFGAKSSSTCLEYAQDGPFDSALLDLALGRGSASGLELAIALRAINPHCGLVIFSQHASAQLVSRLPSEQRFSFSVLEKRAPIDFELLISTLVKTAQGGSSTDGSLIRGRDEVSILTSLSQRDHEIMRMLTDGCSNESVAVKLFLSNVTVRQELSRIYTILVPERLEGTNLRTKAIMRYLEEVRSF